MSITEKFSSHPPIKAEKKASPRCHSIIAESHAVLTPGIGTTAKNLYTNINKSTAIIFFRRSRILNIDWRVESIIK